MINKETNIKPGITAPINKRPTGTPIISPKSIKIILGGIIWPSVPDAAIVPAANDAE